MDPRCSAPRPVGQPRAVGAVPLTLLAMFLAAILVGLVGFPAPAAASTTLPTPKDTVAPEDSVGGPRLASMKLVVDRPSGVPRPPAMPDVSWLVADMDTGDVLAARAAHARLRPASTLKVLTALVLLPRIKGGRTYTVTRADVQVDGSRVGLVPRQHYTRADLFNGMLMASGNDAAYALSRLAGGHDKTIAAMASEAKRLGALDTTPEDPAGLDRKGQYSSAYDLALIARAAMHRSDFRATVARKHATLPGYPRKGKDPHFAINNHNKLLYNYEGTIGVKNGYTIKADHTLITAVHRGQHTYLISQMGGTTNSWHPVAALYDWVFRYGDRLTPVGHLVDTAEVASWTQSSTAGPTTGPTSPAAGTTLGAAAPPAAGSATATSDRPAWMLAGGGLVGLLGCAALVAFVASRALGRSPRPQPAGRARRGARAGRHRR